MLSVYCLLKTCMNNCRFSAVSYEDFSKAILVPTESITQGSPPELDPSEFPLSLRRSLITIPSSVDWRGKSSPVKDQVRAW